MLILSLFGCSLGLSPYNPDAETFDVEIFEEGEALESYTDKDDDGYSVDEGDCNDSDPTIAPDQDDICDGIDNDCDNDIDEDADIDAYETFDDSAMFVGEYFAADSFTIEAMISKPSDIDRYQVYIADPIGGFFQINVKVDSIAGNTDYVVELHLIENAFGEAVGLLQSSDTASYGASESISQGGQPFYDDAGLYEIIIYSNDGSGCDSQYSLTVDFTV